MDTEEKTEQTGIVYERWGVCPDCGMKCTARWIGAPCYHYPDGRSGREVSCAIEEAWLPASTVPRKLCVECSQSYAPETAPARCTYPLNAHKLCAGELIDDNTRRVDVPEAERGPVPSPRGRGEYKGPGGARRRSTETAQI